MYPEFAADRYARLLISPLEQLARANVGMWRLDACGVTPATRAIPALIHADAYDPAAKRMRVVVIGGLLGGAGDVDLAFRVLESFAGGAERWDGIALTAIPCANPDGLALGRGPENAAHGNPSAGYPPDNAFFNHPREPETRYLWRWICQQGPDLVVELKEGDSAYWEANGVAGDVARELAPALLVPLGSLLHALGDVAPSGPGRIPGLRLTSAPRSGAEAAARLWRVIQDMPASVRSPAGAALSHRRARPPIEVARVLARSYGRRLEPVVYTQGVGVSGRLRLHELESEGGDTVSDVAGMVEPYVSGARQPFKDGAGGQDLAGVVWAEELHRLTGDRRYVELMINAARRYVHESLIDPDYRTEDIFFTSAVLGRAGRMAGDSRYLDLLASYLAGVVDQQRPDGLFWHCGAAPYYWGRGNGFAALGFAEALTYLPDDAPVRPRLIDSHRRHLEALARMQAPSGMLRQVLDFPGSYEELSATCMAGYAIARGIRLGWLDPPTFRPMLDRLWTAAAEHVDEQGGLVDVCTGTGVQPDLRAYLDRAAISGHDDRGGSLALWFATEMVSCILLAARTRIGSG